MSIHAKLSELQYKLVAPKGQYNSFGKYRYRNCEDILEAVKPLLHEMKCTLTISDEVVAVGEPVIMTSHTRKEELDDNKMPKVVTYTETQRCNQRFYVKATATLTDIETGESVSTSAYAREGEEKKGMTEEQVSGSCSSYSRKYCLCALLCIDDNKDSDTTNTGTNNTSEKMNGVNSELYCDYEQKKRVFEQYVKDGKIEQKSLDNLNNAEKAAWKATDIDEAFRQIIKGMSKNLADAEKK